MMATAARTLAGVPMPGTAIGIMTAGGKPTGTPMAIFRDTLETTHVDQRER
jgi:hypothetical protein